MILAWGIGFILLCCAVLPLVEWLDRRKHTNRRVPRPNWRCQRHLHHSPEDRVTRW